MNCRDPLIAHLFKGKPEKNPLIPAVYLIGKGPKELNAFLNSVQQYRENWERKHAKPRRPRFADKQIKVSLWLRGDM